MCTAPFPQLLGSKDESLRGVRADKHRTSGFEKKSRGWRREVWDRSRPWSLEEEEEGVE